MTWHTATVPADGLSSLLTRIRNTGGTVACSRPDDDGVHVTWTTIGNEFDREDDPGPAGRG